MLTIDATGEASQVCRLALCLRKDRRISENIPYSATYNDRCPGPSSADLWLVSQSQPARLAEYSNDSMSLAFHDLAVILVSCSINVNAGACVICRLAGKGCSGLLIRL